MITMMLASQGKIPGTFYGIASFTGNSQHLFQDRGDLMSDLYLGMLLVISVMTLIFFGPELGKTMSKRFRRSRRKINRSRVAFKKGMRVRTRKVNLVGNFAHF